MILLYEIKQKKKKIKELQKIENTCKKIYRFYVILK